MDVMSYLMRVYILARASTVPFCSHARIFQQRDNSGHISVLPYIKYIVTSGPFLDKVWFVVMSERDHMIKSPFSYKQKVIIKKKKRNKIKKKIQTTKLNF